MSNYPRGSEWAIWDLHIHTPCSIEQHYGGNRPEVWEKYLQALEALSDDVKVLGITDYYFPDGYERVMEAREKNGRLPKIKTVLPILEFRIDTFGSASESKISKVNLHILFNVDANDWRTAIARVRSEFIERLDISRHLPNKCLSLKNFSECASDGKQRTGFSELYPHTQDVLHRLEGWKDETLLFLGYKEWNDLDKGKQAKLEKQDLFNRVHGILTASRTDLLEQKKQTIAAFGDKALLRSLDIHDFETLEKYECSTWIKAEPTFEGLRQAVALPSERVSHDLRPPKLLSLAERPESIIESIEVRTTNDDGEWFDRVKKQPLNAGLVAIIGNKGMGKTALADAICAAANCGNANYSFLSKDKFFKHRASKKYSAHVTFADGATGTSPFRNLRYDPARPSRVLYLSQSFVENLCNDVEGHARLQEQIDRVIFSEIPIEVSGSHASLDALVRATAESHSKRQSQLQLDIRDVNRRIAEAEAALTAANRKRLQTTVEELEQEIRQHDAARPPDPPPADPTEQTVLHSLLEKFGRHEQAALLRRQDVTLDLQGLGTRRQSLDKLKQDIEALRAAWNNIDRFIEGDTFLRQKLSLGAIVSLSVDLEPLLALEMSLTAQIDSQRAASDRNTRFIESIQHRVTRIQTKLQGKQRQRGEAIVAVQTWQKRRDSLVGKPDTEGSLEYAKAQVQRLDNHFPGLLQDLTKKRRELCADLWRRIAEKEQALTALYMPAQRRAEELAARFEIPKEEFMAFESAIRLASSFTSDFLGKVNRNRAGRFYGSDNAQRQIDLIVQEAMENDNGSWLELPFRVEQALKRGPGGTAARDDWYEQLIGGQAAVAELYDFLFSMQYLEGRFGITYSNKPIELLSPGDRGLLLLVLFLLIDSSPKPIIIDQPEENVDNETIYQRLVQFIRVAKKERQIIIVTHNPNLAVVCDAEQIICASRDKKNRDLIEYRSGGLESDLKDDVVRVLEGTRPAFVTRKQKYGL